MARGSNPHLAKRTLEQKFRKLQKNCSKLKTKITNKLFSKLETSNYVVILENIVKLYNWMQYSFVFMVFDNVCLSITG